MLDQVDERSPKKRTAAAIATAFALYLVLLLVYGLLALGVIWLGANYDQTNSWKAVALLLLFIPNTMASFGAIAVTSRWFRHANRETVFYAFATGIVFLALIVLIGPEGNILNALLTGGLGIGGAWLGHHFAPPSENQHRLR